MRSVNPSVTSALAAEARASGGRPAPRRGRRGRAPPPRDGERLGGGALEVADGPAAAGDHDDRGPCRGQAERRAATPPATAAPRSAGRRGPRTCTTRAPGPAIARTSGIASAWVTRCRSAPGWAQKRSAATSVTTATTGTGRRAERPQPAQDLRRPRVRRHDDVGPARGHGAPQAAAAGDEADRAEEPSRERDVVDEPVGEVEDRVADRRPEARPLQQHPLGERPHGGQAVDDLDRAVRRALRQLVGEHLRGDVVARPDRGAEDDAAQPRRGRARPGCPRPTGSGAPRSRSRAR